MSVGSHLCLYVIIFSDNDQFSVVLQIFWMFVFSYIDLLISLQNIPLLTHLRLKVDTANIRLEAQQKKSHSKPPNTKNCCSIRRCHAWTIERLPSVQLDAKIDGYVYIQKNVINFRAIQTAVNDKYFAFGMEQHRNSSAAKSKTLIATNKHLNSNWRRPCMCPCNNGPTQTTAATTWKKKKNEEIARETNQNIVASSAPGAAMASQTLRVCVFVWSECAERASVELCAQLSDIYMHRGTNEFNDVDKIL